MTEEQKHAETAKSFAESLGTMEGATKKVDRWEARAEEQNELNKRDRESAIVTRDAQRRDHEAHIAQQLADELRAARYEEEHTREWKRNAERHATWLAEVKHAQEHREREVAALDRIANALEQRTK